MRFKVPSRAMKNGFIRLPNCFVLCARMKQLHGIAITAAPGMAGGLKQAGNTLLDRWCKAQRRQAEYDRFAAPRINAGRSNSQQGFVGTGRAKVRCQRAS